jgi:hypothetical protein
VSPSGSPPEAAQAAARAAAATALPPRFVSCVNALCVRPESGACAGPELADLRRCPVGVIAAVDCPEFVGRPCRAHVDRGDRPMTAVPRGELSMAWSELSADYLTEAYARRLRGLRRETPAPRGAEILALAPPAGPASPIAPPRRIVAGGAPINVPTDRDRRRPDRSHAPEGGGRRP